MSQTNKNEENEKIRMDMMNIFNKIRYVIEINS